MNRPRGPLATPTSITGLALDTNPGFMPFLYSYPHVLRAHKPRNGKSSTELEDLDKFRYDELPKLIRARRHATSDQVTQEEIEDPEMKECEGWVELEELQKLMEWKLTRGTPRPRLQSLIASNSPKDVRVITGKAFFQYRDPVGGSIPQHAKPIKSLCELKGVGPATASLILSVARPTEIAFFSDELLAWLRGWTNVKAGRIGYTDKEYDEIVEGVDTVCEKLKEEGVLKDVTATQVEKVTWVILKIRDPDIWKGVYGEEQPEGIPKEEDGVEPERPTMLELTEMRGEDSNMPMKRKSDGGDAEKTAASQRPRRK